MVKRLTKLNLTTLIRNKSKEFVQRIIREYSRTIENDLQREVFDILINDESFQSLQGGDLKAELGLVGAEARAIMLARAVAQTFIKNVTASKASRPAGKSRTTSVVISGLPLDWTPLIGKQFAIQTYRRVIVDPITKKKTFIQQDLPWLRWLVIEGRSRNIVKGYAITRSKIGRSGLPGVMKKSRKGWRVPYRYSGSPTNNMITRAIAKNEKRLQRAAKLSIERAIRVARGVVK